MPSDHRSFTDEQAERLSKLYERADQDITQQIKRYIDENRAPGTTRNLQRLLRNVKATRADLLQGARTWTQATLPALYRAGKDYADKDIPKGSPIQDGFFRIHQQAVQRLADEIYGRFRQVDYTIDESVKSFARRVDDVYRTQQLEAARGVVVGHQTSQQAARKLKRDLEEKGITGFVDKAGRRWELKNYAKMAAVTVSNNAFREGTINRIQERGHDLVVISTHSKPCRICAPYQGQTFSISGNDPDYPPLSSVYPGKVGHPRCKHAISLAPVAKERWFEKLEGKQGEAARQAEITRLAEKAGWKNPFGETSPEEFIKQRDKLPKALLNYLTPYTAEGYKAADVKLKLHESGGGGYGLKGDELISVFSLPGKHLGSELVDDAIANGAKRLDCLGDSLLEFYTRKGFEVVKTDKWDDQYAPKDWDYVKRGRPNLYYMELK